MASVQKACAKHVTAIASSECDCEEIVARAVMMERHISCQLGLR